MIPVTHSRSYYFVRSVVRTLFWGAACALIAVAIWAFAVIWIINLTTP